MSYHANVEEGRFELSIPFAGTRRRTVTYASSAAYGVKSPFRGSVSPDLPVGGYSFSKWLFNDLVPRGDSIAPVVGLRYLHVCGPQDFVHVDDIVAANRWCLDGLDRSGIFDIGAGCATADHPAAFQHMNMGVPSYLRWQTAQAAS